ncbi:peptidase M20/M25/M40 family protein [Senna tora]|uniref:Peptidase M20/M25/M40 family protein n=1 Tax=Senna tora TaxID=362788 RepID=A0A834T7U4_9FABA|nr:peptidase M20/M25/M40 family protein [Senna tora]
MVSCDREGFVMNVQPSEAEAGFDLRLPPTVDPDEMRRRIALEWAPPARNMAFEILLCFNMSFFYLTSVFPSITLPLIKWILCNFIKVKIPITLWGKYVDQITNYMLNITGGAVIIALQYFKLKEYNMLFTYVNLMSHHDVVATPSKVKRPSPVNINGRRLSFADSEHTPSSSGEEVDDVFVLQC